MTPDAYIAHIANEFGLSKRDLVTIITKDALDISTEHFDNGQETLRVTCNREKIRSNIQRLMREIDEHKTGLLFPLRD